MSRTKVLVTLLLLSPFIALFVRNYYVWQLEKYGGTWCHLKDNYQDRWVYIERQEMLDALAALMSAASGKVARGANGEPLSDVNGNYIWNYPLAKKALKVALEDRKKNYFYYRLNQLHSPRRPWTFFLVPPYARHLSGMNDHYIESCRIYSLLKDDKEGK